MKSILALATALLLSLAAHASLATPIEMTMNPGAGAQPLANQFYTYDFGTTTLNFPMYADFTLSNHGPAKLTVSGVGIAGVDFNAFHNCPDVMAPNTMCTIRARFSPWAEGFKTGRLLVKTSDGMIQIDLSGWGRRI